MQTVGTTGNVPSHGISKHFAFWECNMRDHPDKAFRDKILDYVKYGIPIEYEKDIEWVDCENWPSVEEHSEMVDSFIREHIEDGSIEGPFFDTNSVIRCSPLGAFLKKGGEKVRVIHDLSWPPENSVNDLMDKEACRVKYVRVLDAVNLCSQFEEAWLGKSDLKDAYLQCPVREADRRYLGFLWSTGGVQVKMRYASLPFGLRPSALKFTELGTALLYMCKKKGVSDQTISYLDDSLTIAGTKKECEDSLRTLVKTCEEAGFKVQKKKVIGPSKKIEFLGIQIVRKRS